MQSIFQRALSLLLTLVLLINLLPVRSFALGLPEDSQVSDTQISTTPYQNLDTLQIIREDPERRGEYYKEFVLNGGLRMAAVYADAVHYQKDGQWEPIDNTLKLSGGAYVNTAGVWQVSLPQQHPDR